VSVFIPAYNEEKILEESITRVYRKLKELEYNFELFIIDDSSTDSSPIIGGRLADKYKGVRFIGYHNGPSRRENLAKSFRLAEGDIILFMDVDLSTDLKHLKELIESVKRDYDIATGSRHVEGASINRKLSRRIISSSFKYFVKFYFNSKINDHECGFKAFKREIILKLVNEMGYDSEFKRKMFWDAEMLIRAQKKGCRIKEIPVQWAAGEKSALRFFRELSMIPYLLSLRFRL